MNELFHVVRRLVREELALRRGPQLATVTGLVTHESNDDTANYEVDLRLKHDGLELARVPIALPHVGVAAPPREGDLVLVEFLDHDLQQPLVTGRFYHDQERAPLFKQNEVLFEHRVADSDHTINQLRFAADGSIFLQRNVKKLEDNSDFQAGIRIDPEGLIEVKSGDDILLTLDTEGNVSLRCKALEVDGDVTIKKTLTVEGDGKISKVSISGTDITGGA